LQGCSGLVRTTASKGSTTRVYSFSLPDISSEELHLIGLMPLLLAQSFAGMLYSRPQQWQATRPVKEVAPSRGVVRFSAFEVDLLNGEVRKHGIRIRLQDQPFRILQILLQHPGELVTREELQRQIWPAAFVDFDKGLNNAIKRLRDALGDSAEQPRFIETHSRRGYRFIGSLDGANCNSVAEMAVPMAVVPATSRPRYRALSLTALGLLLAVGSVFGLDIGGLWSRLILKLYPPAIHSLAVLPLSNLSNDPNQEYFSDGMTDALITDLAQIGSLKVISRTSSMQYKQTKKSLPEIARELNVDGIVEGTVQRSGDRVRITAQLIYGPSDKHLWANSYDREVRDVLQLEGEVAYDIAGKISARLAAGPGPRPVAARSLNVEAYDNYLKGRNYVRRYTKDNSLKGLKFLERSIGEDPDYAPAYADISLAYQELALEQYSSPAEVLPKAKAAAMRALALDENLAEAHTVLGLVYGRHDWDWAAEEKELRRAVQLDPNSSLARSEYAFHMAIVGRQNDAIQAINTALELDPFSPMQHSIAAWVFLWTREYDSALREGRRAVETDPTSAPGHLALASALGAKGEFQEGFAEWLRYLSLDGDGELAQELGNAAQKISGPGDPGNKLAHITLSYYQKKSKTQYVAALTIAQAYIDLGDKERTLEWLSKAYQEHSNGLYAIAVDPSLDPVRSDPRFRDLLRRMNLPVTESGNNGPLN
jgi:TolB-like protein/DNA-binding winged helix-turn-helix (wHTH) protein